MTGSTYINAIHSSIALGPGTLSANADPTTATLTGSVNLPSATGSFTELGFVPVTATTDFVQDGQTTGTLESSGGIQATSKITLKLTSLEVAGIPIPVGNSCETSVPATIPLTSQAGSNALTGGTVSGTDLHHSALRALPAGHAADQPHASRAEQHHLADAGRGDVRLTAGPRAP